MRGTRILRYVGNRQEPEKELYSFEEILHDLHDFPEIDFAKGIVVNNARPEPLVTEGMLDALRFGLVERALNVQRPPQYIGHAQRLFNSLMGTAANAGAGTPGSFKYPDDFAPLELNLTEALVGWKIWQVDLETEQIYSTYKGKNYWPYDAPLRAYCRNDNPHIHCPEEICSCGIYSADTRRETAKYSSQEGTEVIGLVYGWGRYIRGWGGWRSEFAYPKCFYLQLEQMPLVQKLRGYHVPIFIMAPQLVYNPEEDGYEYRRDEEEGDLRTDPEPATEEDHEENDYND